MVDWNSLKDYWWIFLIVILFIVLIIIAKKYKRKGKISKGECIHDFKLGGVLMFYEKYPRIIYYCIKCGYAIHRPVFKWKNLEK